jgi:hypothetical protein
MVKTILMAFDRFGGYNARSSAYRSASPTPVLQLFTGATIRNTIPAPDPVSYTGLTICWALGPLAKLIGTFTR